MFGAIAGAIGAIGGSLAKAGVIRGSVGEALGYDKNAGEVASPPLTNFREFPASTGSGTTPEAAPSNLPLLIGAGIVLLIASR